MGELALVLWLVYFLITLVLRAALHARRTGHSGLLLMRARAGSTQWWGELAESVAIALGVAAAVLADDLEPLEALDTGAGHVAGVVVYSAGVAGVALSQEAMGASWRIGQDAGERTGLVTAGPFSLVRNPIFSSLVLVQAGLALLVPNALALAGLVLLLVSIQVQVRLVEEPHLRRVHGAAYEDYAAKVGRFIPGLGRL
jgi:protein-S-isoprenylcysteine O-methyltransferase Ste14